MIYVRSTSAILCILTILAISFSVVHAAENAPTEPKKATTTKQPDLDLTCKRMTDRRASTYGCSRLALSARSACYTRAKVLPVEKFSVVQTQSESKVQSQRYCYAPSTIASYYGSECTQHPDCKANGIFIITSGTVKDGYTVCKTKRDENDRLIIKYIVVCRKKDAVEAKTNTNTESKSTSAETEKTDKSTADADTNTTAKTVEPHPPYVPKQGSTKEETAELKRRGLTSAEQAERVGDTYSVSASHYDTCAKDSLNPCGRTSSGTVYDPNSYTIAHKDLRLGTEVQICNGTVCRNAIVNNRGLYGTTRDVDLSQRLARELGTLEIGVKQLQMTVLTNPTDAVAYRYFPATHTFQVTSLQNSVTQ